ncbi:MAG: Ig-like domain-containing protein [Lachnospiraceae bacterium]|nr:Ig-like domain-containing protein [Lachnospiraceae bacterium]
MQPKKKKLERKLLAFTLALAMVFSTLTGIVPGTSLTAEAAEASETLTPTQLQGTNISSEYLHNAYDEGWGITIVGGNIIANNNKIITKIEITRFDSSSAGYGNGAGVSELRADPGTINTSGNKATVTGINSKKVWIGTNNSSYFYASSIVVYYDDPIPVTGITLNKSTTSVKVGKDETLSVQSFTPANASYKDVTWSSDDTSIATVDNEGKVTGQAVGTVTITATATNGTEDTGDDVTATCEVTVSKGDNPITYAETQEVSAPYSENPQTQEFTLAENGQGDVTYGIDSQKKKNAEGTYDDVSSSNYFSLSDANALNISANTPVGTYTVVVEATAAGNDNYESGSKSSTITLTITKGNNTLTYGDNEDQNKKSVELTYNPSADQTVTIAEPTDNKGDVTYEIEKVDNGTDLKSYFGISDDGKTLTVKAKAPAGEEHTVVVKATAAGNDNYNEGSATTTVTLTVKKATPEPVVAPTPTITVVDYVPNKTLKDITFTDATSDAENKWEWVDENELLVVDKTTYQAKIAVDDDNYDYTVVAGYDEANHVVKRTVDLKVNPIDCTSATVTGKTGLTYNGEDQELVNITLPEGGVAGGDMVYAVVKKDDEQTTESAGTTEPEVPTAPTEKEKWSTENPSAKDAGTYYVFYKVDKGEDTNYNEMTAKHVVVTIEQKEIKVIADDLEKNYGEEDPDLTYTVEGMIKSDKADQDTILEGLEITRSKVAIGETDETTDEGDTTTGSGDTSADSDDPTKGEDVGEYAIIVNGENVKGNYKVVPENGILTINPVELTAEEPTAAENLVYNGEEQKLIVVEEESAEEPSDDSADDSADDESEPSVKMLYALVKSDDIDGEPTAPAIPKEYALESEADDDGEESESIWSEEIPAAEDAGTYYVWYMAVSEDTNYIPSVPAYITVEISKKEIIVSSDDVTKVYGDEDPDLTWTAKAAKDNSDAEGSDTEAVDEEDLDAKEALTVYIKRAPGEDVGDYAIIISGDEEQGNYIVTFDDTAKFTITQRELTMSGFKADKTYDGTVKATIDVSKAIFKYENNEYKPNDLSKDDMVIEAAFADANVGEGKDVTITKLEFGGDKAKNYNITYDKTIKAEISPATLRVTALENSKPYGETDPDLEYFCSGLVDADKDTSLKSSKETPKSGVLTGNLSRESGESIGEYKILQGTLKAQNYDIEFTGATFTITNGVIKPAVAVQGWTYGDKANEPLVTGNTDNGKVTNYYCSEDDFEAAEDKESEDLWIKWDSNEVSKLSAGTYYVRAKVDATDNYGEAYAEPSEFKIDKKQVGVEWANTSFDYNGEAQKPSAVATGVLNNDKIEVVVNGEKTNAGTYTATAVGLTGENADSYELLEATTSFTINKVTPTVKTAPAASAITYGDSLSDSTLEKGIAEFGEKAVEGTFDWKDDTTKPAVADSEKTEYDVVFTPKDAVNYNTVECKVKVTVNKADPSVDKTPAANTLTYNGEEQALVNEGTTTDGTINYAIGTDAKTAPTEGWSEEIPTATDAGTYYVWYKVVGNDNNNDTEPVCIEVVIEEEKAPETPVVETVDMHRLYNPNSGEHFYTASVSEKNTLVAAGWRYEGIGWKAPVTSDTPVYRLYNKNAGDHHYTRDVAERDKLVAAGWKYEGIGWYSDDNEGVALYRQYNPNAKAGSHNYTASKSENDKLVGLGWKGEGIGWYGVK